MSGDWLKLHRKAIDSKVFSDPWIWKLWTWCLMKACWKTCWKNNREIRPGQFIAGRLQAAEQLNVSPSKWYRGMQKLQEWGQLTIEANSQFSVVTICNWQLYQSEEDEKWTASEQRVNSEWTADEQRMNSGWTLYEECKEGKEGKEIITTPKPPSRAGPNKNRFDPLTVDLPPPLDTPEFRDAWVDWCAHRREKKKPLTPTSVKSQLAELASWGLGRAIAAIRYSIRQGWEGLFEENLRGGKTSDKKPLRGEYRPPQGGNETDGLF